MKLLNCNANTYFDKTCLEKKNIIPRFASTKIQASNTSTAAKCAEKQAHKI